MALRFQYRSSQLDLYYASGMKTGVATLNSIAISPAALASATGMTGVFGAQVLDVRTGAGVRPFQWPGFDNWTETDKLTILMRIVPTWTGNPAAIRNLFRASGGMGQGYLQSGLNLSINSNGSLSVSGFDKSASGLLQSAGTASALTSYLVTNQAVDLWVTWDALTTTAKLWAALSGNAPVVVQTMSAVAGTNPTRLRGQVQSLIAGVGNSEFYINEIAHWDSIEDPTAYGTRTDFISASNFEGANNTDPGVANVRSGTTWFLAGIQKAGTAAIPSAANVRFGTAVDATTGTARIPTAGNVRTGVLVDATTGTAAIPSAAQTLSGVAVDATVGTYVGLTAGNVKHGVTFGAGSALTGTYRGYDLWTAVSPNDIFLGQQYMQDGVLTVGLLDEPDTSVVKHGFTYYLGARVGTYRGNDLWSDPGETYVAAGVSYLADGVTKTGTKQVVTNLLYNQALTGQGGTAGVLKG